MNTLNIRIFGLAIALPLIAIQIAGAEDLKVTATKKLNEAAEKFQDTEITRKALLQVNEKQVTLMRESIEQIQERLKEVMDDSDVPAARKRIMQKELLSKKRTLVEGILESLNEGEEGVMRAIQNYQDSISGANTAAKYLKGYEMSLDALESVKAEGRDLVKDYQRMQTEVEYMDRADPNYLSARLDRDNKKDEILEKLKDMKRVSQKKDYMRVMADRAEMFKDRIIVSQEQMLRARRQYKSAIREYEHALEMIELQEGATSMAEYPTNLVEVNQTLNNLFAISDDLNSQSADQMMLPIFDEEGNVEFRMNTVDDDNFDEMIKAFYE